MSDTKLYRKLEQQASVLIVDDISENLQLLGKILDEQDIEFSVATNGKEALETISSHKPDLILLDVNMPVMTGFEVCKILKENPDTKDIPVIFLTAKSEKEDIVQGFSVGGIDYITKPFNSKELISRVKSQLDLSISKQMIAEQNEQLHHLNSELKETLTSRDRFYSIIAHDLKEPFQTLIGFSTLLLESMDERKPEDIRRLVEYINQSSLNGFELLNNLLEWSRSQIGSMKLRPVRFNPASLANGIINLLNATAEKKEISLNSDIPEDLHAFADEKMIQTVVRNLISNALKFTKPGGEVRIVGRELDDSVEISVSDTGVGIPEENLSKLFSISDKLSTPGTNNETGTGLGLLLCKEFVEKNGGKITVHSISGTGSDFSFSIPKNG